MVESTRRNGRSTPGTPGRDAFLISVHFSFFLSFFLFFLFFLLVVFFLSLLFPQRFLF